VVPSATTFPIQTSRTPAGRGRPEHPFAKPHFGIDPNAANYVLAFRNPTLSYLTAERLVILCSEKALTSKCRSFAIKGIL
jgi:hypothetical protein